MHAGRREMGEICVPAAWGRAGSEEGRAAVLQSRVVLTGALSVVSSDAIQLAGDYCPIMESYSKPQFVAGAWRCR